MRRILPAALALVAAALLVGAVRCHRDGDAAALALAKAERDSARAAERRALALRARADTVYLRDTLRLTATRRRTDTVLARITDTLVHVDTVRVLVEAERRSCDAPLRSGELRLSACDSTAAALRRQLAATERIAGLTRRKWTGRLGVFVGVGASAAPNGDVNAGAVVGAGVRVWP